MRAKLPYEYITTAFGKERNRNNSFAVSPRLRGSLPRSGQESPPLDNGPSFFSDRSALELKDDASGTVPGARSFRCSE